MVGLVRKGVTHTLRLRIFCHIPRGAEALRLLVAVRPPGPPGLHLLREVLVALGIGPETCLGGTIVADPTFLLYNHPPSFRWIWIPQVVRPKKDYNRLDLQAQHVSALKGLKAH